MLSRDRTSYSFGVVLGAHIASPVKLSIESENIILAALRAFEFSHSLALQLQLFPEMGFARVGLMSPAPRRPCEDVSERDAPLGKLHGGAADFLDRPADQERCFCHVFLGRVLAR
jgi:hypothetical protein